MRLDKIIKIIFVSFTLLCIFTMTVFASTTDLFRHSDYTYVTSYHPKNFFSDEYIGTASVLGTDRVVRYQETYGFAWTRITYDVQGDESSKTANSNSNYDNVARKVTLKVYDKWNFGSKTEAYFNVGYRWFSSDF